MIRISESDARPPFEQIREQLTDQIRAGQVPAGHRLPSVRQLAGDLHLAPGTIARAYSQLEADGLLETTRAGTRVRDVEEISESARAAARTFIATAGVQSLDEAIRVLRVEWPKR